MQDYMACLRCMIRCTEVAIAPKLWDIMSLNVLSSRNPSASTFNTCKAGTEKPNLSP